MKIEKKDTTDTIFLNFTYKKWRNLEMKYMDKVTDILRIKKKPVSTPVKIDDKKTLPIERDGVAYLIHLANPIRKRVSFCPAPCLFFSFPARFQLFHAFFSTGSGFLSRALLTGPGYSVWILTIHFTYLQHQHDYHTIIYMNLTITL